MADRFLELVCPAGTPAALRAAVNAGADIVYAGFRDETNARNFPGLNFTRDEMAEGIQYAHSKGSKVYIAINTYCRAANSGPWKLAVEDAESLNADAIILADVGLLEYAASHHPGVRRHLSVQASASNADTINFFQTAFDVKRVVLPRVLTLPEISALNSQISVETEVFAFGGMCVMAEGRCSLSSYITGQSPNMNGVCSPASHVKYERQGRRLISKLGGFTINEFDEHEPAGYPTLCKGRFRVNTSDPAYIFEEPTSLNVLMMLPELKEAGVSALKIEGRQRSKAYVARVVTAFRKAVDAAAAGDEIPAINLGDITEGGRDTAGAYKKAWR